jgi:hypothetical protein
MEIFVYPVVVRASLAVDCKTSVLIAREKARPGPSLRSVGFVTRADWARTGFGSSTLEYMICFSVDLSILPALCA